MPAPDGCEFHGVTEEQVAARWCDPHLEDAGDSVGMCWCCGGPCLVVRRAAVLVGADGLVEDVLPGGVADPTACSRCLVITPEQDAELMARLNRE